MPKTLKKPQGRGPSLSKTAETKKAVLVAGLDLFLQNGFMNTRMSDVAKNAGLAKGTLYLYFESKEALFEGVLIDALREPLADSLLVTHDSNESVKSLVLRTFAPILRDFEKSRRAEIIRLVLAEGSRFPALAQTYRRVVLEPMMNSVRLLAQRARSRGELRTDALEKFPLLFVAPGLVATVWNGLFNAEDAIDSGAVFEAFIDAIFV